MRSALLLVLTATFVCAGGVRDSGSAPTKLEGTWTIVSVENRGKKEKAAEGDIAIFKGNKVTFTIGSDKDTAEFRIDASKKPGWFDITTGDYKSVGIYKVEKDTLTVALNQSGTERPNAFKSEADSPNERLFVLKHAK